MNLGMNLARVAQSHIGKAARESALSLTAEQVRDIAEVESVCLAEYGRVSFGESASARIIREFATSPFMPDDGAADALLDLTEAFYELREDFPAFTTDMEILDAIHESFDGEACGEVALAASMARESLSSQLDHSTYEITDNDGNVYRWNPDEWHDDVMADGWCGERWEDADE